jgi:PAS domain S-box-containing protein
MTNPRKLESDTGSWRDPSLLERLHELTEQMNVGLGTPFELATFAVNLIEAAPDAIVVINARGNIVLVNSQAEQLFGRPRAELLTLMIEDLIPERFRVRHQSQRAAYMEDPIPRPMGQGIGPFVALHREGHEIPVMISLSPMITPAEGGPFVIAFIRKRS